MRTTNPTPRPARGRACPLLLATLLLLFAGWPALAQTIGRVELTVIDAEGEPVEGASIVVTSEELTRFRQEVKTNKRGRAAISVVDATKEYLFHVEAEGFAPAEQWVSPRPQETVRREIQLAPEGQTATAEAPGGAPAPAVATYTPAQLAFNEGVEELRASATDPAATEAKLDAAVAKFEEALEKDPALAEAWSALAVAQAEREDWDAAIEASQRYIEMAGGNASVYRVLYRAHQALGNPAEAEQARDELAALGEGQDSAAFAYNEGVAAVRIGDDATAIERFEEALELNPELSQASLGLAIIHLRQNRFEEAAAAAGRLLELDPDNLTGWMVRWQSARALGDAAAEEEARAEIARRDPTPIVNDLLNRSRELFDAGNAKAAAAELEPAAALAPDNPMVHYRLGLAYVSAGEQAKAKTHLERFLALAPDHAEAAAAREMLSYLQ